MYRCSLVVRRFGLLSPDALFSLLKRGVEGVVHERRPLNGFCVIERDQGKRTAYEAQSGSFGDLWQLLRVGVTDDHAHCTQRWIIAATVLYKRFEWCSTAHIARRVRRAWSMKTCTPEATRLLSD